MLGRPNKIKEEDPSEGNASQKSVTNRLPRSGLKMKCNGHNIRTCKNPRNTASDSNTAPVRQGFGVRIFDDTGNRCQDKCSMSLMLDRCRIQGMYPKIQEEEQEVGEVSEVALMQGVGQEEEAWQEEVRPLESKTIEL
ncbi:hypothetical protein GH714_004944 [Hevea brasiliensis]|uniref:Uncharacterized protein n=1 Tax=Hevea brasiliensis TaxID=3981 RepID=A0A6A6L742_HEVBR|nr:hypothetical protein GH714_004944 [Hevea brasiliensis]